MKILALFPPDSLSAVDEVAAELNGEARQAGSLGELLGALGEGPWDVTILSLTSGRLDEAVLERISATGNAGSLVLTRAGASLDAAVLAERLDALALLREPLDPLELRRHLHELGDEGDVIPLPEAPGGEEGGDGPLVGDSPEIGRVYQLMAKVAHSSATVLITGESGTGKEVVARAVHARSERRDGPFVAVNCAAIPEQLLESELFGHEKGAFTGAVARRAGRFQRADGGTLFLDEIGDMSVALQGKLLRALEDRQVERVGSQGAEAVDVRVLAATNQRLAEAIEDGRFREDLFYRLAVVEIELPPLRARGSDIRRLALHFAALFARKHGRPIRGMTERTMERLEASPWVGNVRELKNVMHRAVLLTPGDVLRVGSLRLGAAAPRTSSASGPSEASGYPATASLAEVEADHVRRVLASVDGHISNAAEVLGIHRNTLRRKLQEYGLDSDHDARSP